MDGEMENKYTAYCGLYCGHCFSRTHIKPTAETLLNYMKRQGFETFGPYMPNYKEFWEFLNTLIDAEGCPGCKQDGGNPACEMRNCARNKHIEACPLCEDYPCTKFDWLPDSEAYPMLKSDNQYMKAHGFDAWLEMQKKRRLEGFTYIESRERLDSAK
jgi:hypothetical protein